MGCGNSANKSAKDLSGNSGGEKPKAAVKTAKSTIWLFGNPMNQVIIQLDMNLKNEKERCKTFNVPKAFKWFYKSAYVRISEREVICVGGTKKLGTQPESIIQLLELMEGDVLKITKLGKLNIPRNNPTLLFYSENIFVSGGQDKKGEKLKSVE